jgi:protein transport protein HofC
MMYAVGATALVFWVATIAGLWLITGSIVLLVAMAIGGAVLFARKTATQQESLLWALAVAAERGVPLSPAALAFSDQFDTSYRWRAQLLAALLDQGKTLPEALDEVPGLVTREAQVLLRTGWATGTLPKALREAAALRAARQAAWGSVAGRLAYLIGILMAMQTVGGFVLYFITPKFEAIFRDFGIPLPQVTILTIHVGHWLVGRGLIPVVLLAVGEVLALVLLLFGLFNVFQWDIPLVDALFRRRHASLLLRALALTIEGGHPVTLGVGVEAEEYPSGWVRRRLRKVRLDVEHGGDWVESLRDHGLISRSDAAVLAAAQRAGNLTWALRETSNSAERRFGYRVQLWTQTLFPVVVLSIGFLVMVYAVAYFFPIVRLIERLAG